MKALDRAVYSRLSLDGTLATMLSAATAMAPEIAPPAVALPFITWTYADPGADEYVYTGTAWERFEIVVKSVTAGLDPEAGEDIGERIHALLQDAALSISGYSLMRIRRLARVRYFERGQAGAADSYWHIGGRYVVEVDPS